MSDQDKTQVRANLILEPNCNINSLESFNAITGLGHELAGLYFYCLMDHLIDLAYAVAEDFSKKRFHLYSDNSPENALSLLRICTRYGNDEIYLSKQHRQMIWRSLFGQMPANGANGDYSIENVTEGYNFPDLRDRLLDTASEYVTRAELETGAPGLIASFRLALIPFKQYIMEVQGAAVRVYRTFTFPLLTEGITITDDGDNGLFGNIAPGRIYQLLRSAELTAVFGVNRAIIPDSPYAFDERFNTLVKEISDQLQVKDDYGMPYDQKRESYLETAAKRGACAISAAIEIDPEGSNDQAIIESIFKFYNWKIALDFLANYAMYKPVRAEIIPGGVAVAQPMITMQPIENSQVESNRS